MSIVKLKKIINMLLEAEIQSSATSETEVEPYGKILFSPQRLDNVDKTEPNTEEENKLKFALQSHYSQDSIKSLGPHVPSIFRLLQQGKYTEILKPAPGYVYRILSNLDSKTAANLIGVDEEELIMNASERPWILEKPIQLNPKNIMKSSLQSWTYNLIKLDFGSFRLNNVELIFEAPVEGNTFFMNPRTAEKINFLQTYKDEFETISVGTIICSRVLVYYTVTRKTNIDIELLKKYITIINKKGYELEKIINKEILDFYHDNGLFFDVNSGSDLEHKLNNLSRDEISIIRDLRDKDLIHKHKIKIFNDFNRFFRLLQTKLESMLKRDFGPEYVNVINYFGFDQPTYNFSKTREYFPNYGRLEFLELDIDNLTRMIISNNSISNKNGIANVLFRAFQRKQKY